MRRFAEWAGGLVVFLAGMAAACYTQELPIVHEIGIRHIGPPAASDSVIRANIRTAVDQQYSASAVDADVRRLYEMGLFANVQVRRETVTEGLRIIFVLQGKPKIRDIVITGNKKLRAQKLRKELTIKVNEPMDGRKIEDSVAKLVEIYQKQGYQQIKILHEEAVDPDTGQAVVTFHVEEGLRILIQEIDFVGNRVFTTKQLRKQIRTKGIWMFSWLSRANRVREEIFEQDKDRLRNFYQERGYLDMEIKEVKFDLLRPDRVRLRITLFEGQQYKAGEIQFDGNEKFPTSLLRSKLKMVTGNIFSPGGLETDAKVLRDFYGTKGYIDLRIVPEKSPNLQTSRMDLIYRMSEGDISYIEKIEIRGNTKTKDKVVRRELAVRPGQIFDMVRVNRSRERLENLGYFEKVVIEAEPTDIENRKNLGIEVVEKRTGNILFGAGAGTVEQVFGFVEVSQSNFDLFNPPLFQGGGQKARLRAQVGMRSQYYLLSFTEPWFLDKKLALGFDLFRDQLSFVSDVYKLRQVGGDLKFSKALTEFITGEIKYELKEVTIFDVSKDNVSKSIQQEQGSRSKSSFTFTVRRDTRDSVFVPTRGNSSELSAQFAGGPLGANTDIYKLEARTAFFFPLWLRHVLELRLATGVVDAYGPSDRMPFGPSNRVPLFDRFFLGGPNTLRGFRYNDVGPKESSDPGRGDSLGGDTYAVATVEYTIPIITLPKAGVRLAMFYDAGNVWAEAYHYNFSSFNDDVGIGLRLVMMNIPIRIDYGVPLRHDPFNNRGGQFNFSLGYQF